mmetsp:Transcript_78613/g.138586  ORF Transcript_78613/g.138586 Transcript_78613/m.138586 type:complete len:742 (-) Transcript_78613:8-2233(-)
MENASAEDALQEPTTEIRCLIRRVGSQMGFAADELREAATLLESNWYDTCDSLSDLSEEEAAQLRVPSRLLRALRTEALKRSVSTAVASASALAVRSLKQTVEPPDKEDSRPLASEDPGDESLRVENRPTDNHGDELPTESLDVTQEPSSPSQATASPSGEGTQAPGTPEGPEGLGQGPDQNELEESEQWKSLGSEGAVKKELLPSDAAASGSPRPDSVQPSYQRQGQQPRQHQLMPQRARADKDDPQRSQTLQTRPQSHAGIPQVAAGVPRLQVHGQEGVAGTSQPSRVPVAVSPTAATKGEAARRVESCRGPSSHQIKAGGFASATSSTIPSNSSRASSTTSVSVNSIPSQPVRQVQSSVARPSDTPSRRRETKSDAVTGSATPKRPLSPRQPMPPPFSSPSTRSIAQHAAVLSPRGSSGQIARVASPRAPVESGTSRAISPRMPMRRQESPKTRPSPSPPARPTSPRTAPVAKNGLRPESPQLRKPANSASQSDSLRLRKPMISSARHESPVSKPTVSSPSRGPTEVESFAYQATQMRGSRPKEEVQFAVPPRRPVGASREDRGSSSQVQALFTPRPGRTPQEQPPLVKPQRSSASLTMPIRPQSLHEDEAFLTPREGGLRSLQEGTRSSPRLQTLSSGPLSAAKTNNRINPLMQIPSAADGSMPLSARGPSLMGQRVPANSSAGQMEMTSPRRVGPQGQTVVPMRAAATTPLAARQQASGVPKSSPALQMRQVVVSK